MRAPERADTSSPTVPNMTWKSRFIPIAATTAVLVISAFLYPQTVQTLNILGRAGELLLSPKSLISRSLQMQTPQAGEQVLPPAVQSMLALLRTNGISTYRYSETIAANEEIRQRLIEGAFPVRYDAASFSHLRINGEEATPGCKPLASREGVALVHCP